MLSDNKWLAEAVKLVWASIGKTAPNPPVAAIIVKNNKIIAQGVHLAAGGLHAEQIALANCRENPLGATLYVTLEPCNHIGKTPACTSAIMVAGLKRVVYGCSDANPKVLGSGSDFLQNKGVICENLNDPACLIIYQAFFQWAQQGKSSITLKIAVDQSMNTAANDSSPLRITSKNMHGRVGHWRAFHDAIITSDNCVINDNPRFNARLPNAIEAKPLIILATSDKFNISQNIFQTCGEIYLFLPTGVILRDRALQSRVQICYYQGESLPWADLLQQTAKLGLHRIWAEFGAKTSKYMIEQKIATDVLLIQGKSDFGNSSSHLRDLRLPEYPVRSLYETSDAESIFHMGCTRFPELFLHEDRLCLPE